jgi:hypothetical protein
MHRGKKKDGLIQIRVPCPCHGKVMLSDVKGCDLFLALPSHYKANLHNWNTFCKAVA